jgi:ssRNA-specific RNase YbeY (16S rRNA maturation enzyme)
VGKRKGRELAKKYLHDNIEHPVLTFPYKNGEEIISDQSRTPALLGEIVICYPQVTLFAAQNNREINKVIAQFLDHAANILKQKLKE